MKKDASSKQLLRSSSSSRKQLHRQAGTSDVGKDGEKDRVRDTKARRQSATRPDYKVQEGIILIIEERRKGEGGR